jgi:hypothetical protein
MHHEWYICKQEVKLQAHVGENFLPQNPHGLIIKKNGPLII